MSSADPMMTEDAAAEGSLDESSQGQSAEQVDDLSYARERLFITKDVDQLLGMLKDTKHRLPRTLGWFDVLILGIGAIIGAGIFVLVGVVTALYAGPGVVLSFILVGIVCIIVALCYSELASMLPIAGSSYTYSYASIGEIVAWMVAWSLVLEYSVGAGAVAVGWSGYIGGLLQSVGVVLPKAITTDPSNGGVINLPAMLIVLGLTALLYRGTKESARFNMILVATKLAVIGMFLIGGLFYFNPAHFTPFMPYGAGGVLTGGALVFFAYLGFESLATTAEEVKDPQRDMTIGIIGSLSITTLLYIGIAVVLIGMVAYTDIDIKQPLAAALVSVGQPGMANVLAIGALFGITSVLMVSLLAQPRIYFALARDGLLPGKLARIHPRFGTPALPTLVSGFSIALVAGITPITTAAAVANVGTLFAFILVCLSVPLLRKRAPDARRPFRMPFNPILPIIGVISCIGLMLSLFIEVPLSAVVMVAWMGCGLLLYANYGYYHSRVATERGYPDARWEPDDEPSGDESVAGHGGD